MPRSEPAALMKSADMRLVEKPKEFKKTATDLKDEEENPQQTDEG